MILLNYQPMLSMVQLSESFIYSYVKLYQSRLGSQLIGNFAEDCENALLEV